MTTKEAAMAEAREIVETAKAWALGDERTDALADAMVELVAASIERGAEIERGRGRS